jgi:type I restriction enzyme S subunit
MKAGWQTLTFGELGRVYNGNSINESEKKAHFEGQDHGTPYIGTKDVSFDHEINYESGVRIPDGKQDGFKLAPANTVFVCAEGGSAGRKIAHTDREVYFGNKLFAICPTPPNSSRFVYYYCISDFFSKQFKNAMAGLIGGVSINKFKDLIFTFPPIHEQQRLVRLLDEAFDRIATAKAKVKKNLQNAHELFQSYQETVFTQGGEGWVEKYIGDESLFEIIDGDRGVNYPKKSDFFGNGHCLFLNTKNVRPDGFSFDSTMFITVEKDNKLRKGKLQRNDVVMTTRGTIGNIGLYSEDIPFDNIRINSGMLIFRPNKRVILPSFLFELLRSTIVKDQIKKYTTGAAQPQLPIKTLINFVIPVPRNLEDQQDFVSRLHAFEPETKRLESIYQRKLSSLDELKKSLLNQAFNGEL